MDKLKQNTSFQINTLNERLHSLEQIISGLEKKVNLIDNRTTDHLLRVKNREVITDQFLLEKQTYNDLSPNRSKKVLKSKSYNYILIDVSESNYFPAIKLKAAQKVTLEQLKAKEPHFINHSTPIFIISEDGTRSVLACEYLNSIGYFNVNNISGGYEYWSKSASKKSSKTKAA